MKIYFDENFSPRLVEGLRAFQKGTPNEGVEVLSIAETFGRGTADEEWIPKVAQQHAVVITQDLNIHRRNHQWALCQQYKIGIIFFQPPKKGWSYWAIIQLAVKLWKEVTKLSIESPRPFTAEVKATAGRLKVLK
jgi:predicted nuclease of predicted toxin-antitoxin system